jgi:LacI family transcriptional regulator
VPLAHDRPMFGTWSEAWGRTATRTLLTEAPGFDGLVCASDQIARGALDALREEGIRVPHDVAVVSFDNWEILATGSRPQLTSVDMDFETIGRLAAERLFEALDGDPGSGVIAHPTRLVVRVSRVVAASPRRAGSGRGR